MFSNNWLKSDTKKYRVSCGFVVRLSWIPEIERNFLQYRSMSAIFSVEIASGGYGFLPLFGGWRGHLLLAIKELFLVQKGHYTLRSDVG